jgi:hypothetical protein
VLTVYQKRPRQPLLYVTIVDFLCLCLEFKLSDNLKHDWLNHSISDFNATPSGAATWKKRRYRSLSSWNLRMSFLSELLRTGARLVSKIVTFEDVIPFGGIAASSRWSELFLTSVSFRAGHLPVSGFIGFATLSFGPLPRHLLGPHHTGLLVFRTWPGRRSRRNLYAVSAAWRLKNSLFRFPRKRYLVNSFKRSKR